MIFFLKLPKFSTLKMDERFALMLSQMLINSYPGASGVVGLVVVGFRQTILQTI